MADVALFLNLEIVKFKGHETVQIVKIYIYQRQFQNSMDDITSDAEMGEWRERVE